MISSATKLMVCLFALSVSAGPLPGSPVVDASSNTMLHALAARPSFEVVSIRPSAPGAESRFSGVSMQQGRIEIRGFSVKGQIPTKVRNVPQNIVESGCPHIRFRRSEPHLGKPYRPAPTRDVGSPEIECSGPGHLASVD